MVLKRHGVACWTDEFELSLLVLHQNDSAQGCNRDAERKRDAGLLGNVCRIA